MPTDEHAIMPERIAIVVSRYNRTATGAMLDGAVATLRERFGPDAEPAVFWVPGAYELPVVCAHACESGRFDAVVALGCVVRGETDHDRYIAHAVADAIAGLSCQSGVPIAFGVLTVNSAEQALARSAQGDVLGGKGNKGREAMQAVLDTLAVIDAIHAGDPSAGTPRGDGVGADKLAPGGGLSLSGEGAR